ncbi:hypothetical protein [Emticicia fluvialis]|uniref:hypothetical protein n=1 Tax=Emticicia fluvialis TaxID=2974474 RepID=UPI002166708D|nr:hypothetical protein [Emticicia fluvialis]
MKKHNGMRPQDIVILMAIIASSKISNAWNQSNFESKAEENKLQLKDFVVIPANNKTLAQILQISESEISESLYRSSFSGLIEDVKTKKINKRALLDFLIYGIKYVFPARPAGLARGIATAHSADPLKHLIISEDKYIWEHPEGDIRGQVIEPLYPSIPSIVRQNNNLYELLSLIDGIRTGSSRIIKIASQELEKRITDAWPPINL